MSDGLKRNRSPGDNVTSTHQLHRAETSCESAKKSRGDKLNHRWTLDEWLGRIESQVDFDLLTQSEEAPSERDRGEAEGELEDPFEILSLWSEGTVPSELWFPPEDEVELVAPDETDEDDEMPERIAIKLRKFHGNPHEDADEHLDVFEETMVDHGVVGDKAYTDRFQCTLRGAALTWMKSLPSATRTSWGNLSAAFLDTCGTR